MGGHDPRHDRPSARQLLDEPRRDRQRQIETAEVAGDEGAEQSEVGHRPHDFAGPTARPLPVGDYWNDLPVDHLADGEDEPAFVLLAASRGSGAAALENLAGDDQPLDLVGALTDDHQRRVAVETLGGQRRELAGFAMDAYGEIGQLLRGLRR